MKSCQRHLSLQSLWTLLLTVTLITLTQHSSTFTASALRHTFSVKHDTRFFIGPISTPYGFNENGEYKLTVSKFRVRVSSSSSSSRKNTDPTPEQMFEEIKGLHPGFLLKKFNNENQFNRFMDEILDNPDKCGFGDLMSYLDDNFEVDNGFFENKHDHNSNGISEVGDDDTVSPKSSSVIVDKMVARGPGVVDGGKDGIFLSMNHPKMWKPEEPTLFHTFTAEEAGYYFLFYQICLEPDVSKSGKKDKFLFRELQSTFHLDFDYVNKDALGNRTYLTAGEVMLPHLYLYFSVSYALLLFLWVRSLRGDGNGGFGGTGGRVTVYAIHHLMSAVLALKTLSIFFESLRYHFIRVNGHAELWSFIYYLFTFVKGTFLFTLILLLGSGWSFFKPFLKPKERRIIYFVFILQVIDNIAVVVLTHETLGERLYSDWSAVLHLVDIVSCCAILIPIVWQVNALEQSLDQQTPVGDVLYVDNDNSNSNLDTSDGNDDQNPEMEGGVVLDGESTRLKEKLDLFRSFYLTVVAYIYFTRIVVYLLASALSYNHTWWRYLIAELGTLLFYVTIGIKFRPRVESPGYSTILQNEDDFENGAIVRSKQNNLEMSSMVSSAQTQGGKQA